nr:hypothetical protein [Tanacetum cinerariifolium]
EVSTAEDVSTAESVSTAGGAAVTTTSISTASPTKVSTADDITLAKTLVYIRRSATKDKGKGIMTESKQYRSRQSCSKNKKDLAIKQL